MLLGLPSALRIYHGLDAADAECPLTVRDGRDVSGRRITDNETPAAGTEDMRRISEADRPVAMRMKDICFRYERELPDVLDGSCAVRSTPGRDCQHPGRKRRGQDDTAQRDFRSKQALPRQN